MTTEFARERILGEVGYVRLVDRWGSDRAVVEAARMSTQKGFLGWGYEECTFCGVWQSVDPEAALECPDSPNGSHDFKTREGDEKLLRFLWEKKHATPFEMAGFSVEVQAPIFVFREWHRHRVQAYSEASARYAPLPSIDYLPTVERCLRGGGHLTRQAGSADGAGELTPALAAEWLAGLETIYGAVEEHYQKGLALGVPKEVARCSMVVARLSTMRAQAVLRNWFAFLQLRDSKEAQEEIRLYAGAVDDLTASLFPRSHQLYAEGRQRDAEFGRLLGAMRKRGVSFERVLAFVEAAP